MSIVKSAAAVLQTTMAETTLSQISDRNSDAGKKAVAKAQKYVDKACANDPSHAGAAYLQLYLGHLEPEYLDRFCQANLEDLESDLKLDKKVTATSFPIQFSAAYGVQYTTCDAVGVLAFILFRRTATGDFDGAATVLHHAWKLCEAGKIKNIGAPSVEHLRIASAMYLGKIGSPQEGLKVLAVQQQWSGRDTYGLSFLVRGMLHFFLGSYGEALTGFETGIANAVAGSVLIFSQVGKADCLVQLGGDAERRNFIDAVATKNPNFPTFYSNQSLISGIKAAPGTGSGTREQTTASQVPEDPRSGFSPEVQQAMDLLAEREREQVQTAGAPQNGVAEQVLSRDPAALVAEADEELTDQVGLTEVKQKIQRLKASVLMDRVKAQRGLRVGSRTHHLIFTGPPGTGKTTIARVVAKYFCGLGILDTDNVLEVSRSDLVGQHLGETALKTEDVVMSALDGVLFIDEAYSLIQSGLSGGDAFGREAVDTLLALMENHRDRLVVIIAGYDDEIDDFLKSNAGLASRFATRIRFASYTATELAEIAVRMAENRGLVLSRDAIAALISTVADLEKENANDGDSRLNALGNARFVRNILDKAEEAKDQRLIFRTNGRPDQLSTEELTEITGEDMASGLEALLLM